MDYLGPDREAKPEPPHLLNQQHTCGLFWWVGGTRRGVGVFGPCFLGWGWFWVLFMGLIVSVLSGTTVILGS